MRDCGVETEQDRNAPPAPDGEPAGAATDGPRTGARQLFTPAADAYLRLTVFGIMACIVGFFLLVGALPNSSYATGVGTALDQPVPFSHKHHVGELGIDCRYCHTTVTTQASAGMPPTHTCMTCHSQIWTKAPMLAPVRASFADNQPLDWKRVNQLPDYVYFNHAIHVAKGIGCSSCHGPVTTMQLTWRAHAFTMGFCLSCHRNPAAALRPAKQVWNMEWTPPADQAAIGRKLMVAYHIMAGPRLTDCAICHR